MLTDGQTSLVMMSVVSFQATLMDGKTSLAFRAPLDRVREALEISESPGDLVSRWVGPEVVCVRGSVGGRER